LVRILSHRYDAHQRVIRRASVTPIIGDQWPIDAPRSSIADVMV
jgi:hypothetical protein